MSRPSPSHQTESAFVALLREWKQTEASALGPCTVYPGQGIDLTQVYELPSLVATAGDMVEMTYDSGLFEGRLKVALETQVDDETSSLLHRARIQELRELLEDFGNLILLLNAPPAPATDTREVKNFALNSLVYKGEQQSQVDRRLRTELEYEIELSIG